MKYFIAVISFFLLLYNGVYSQSGAQQKLKLAEGYEKAGDFQNASRVYEELFYSNPSDDKFFEGVVRTKKALNQFSDLQQIVEKRLSIKRTASTLILYGEVLWKLGKTNEAIINWDKALKEYSKDLKTYELLSQTQSNLLLFDKAIETLLKARKEFKSPNLYANELSLLYLAIGNYKDGVEEVIKYFDDTKNFADVQGRIQAFLISSESEKYINDILYNRAEIQKLQDYYYLYAWFLRATNKLDEALRYYIKIDKMTNKNGYEVYNFAESCRRDGNIDISLKAYSYIIDSIISQQYLQPALFGYANALERKIKLEKTLPANFVEQVIGRYRDITKRFPNSQLAYNSTYRIAFLYNTQLRRNDLAKAELNKILNVNNIQLSIQAKLLLSEIYIEENLLNDAQNLLSDIIKYENNKQIATEIQKAKFLRAELLFYNGLIDSAQNAYAEIALDPTSFYTNDAMEMINIIEQFKTQNKAINLFAKAKFKERQKKFNEAIELYKEAGKADLSGELNEICLMKIGELYFENEEYENSIKVMEEFITSYPENIYLDKAMFLMADSYMKIGDRDKALKTYNDILNKFQYSIYLQDAREKIRKLRAYQ